MLSHLICTITQEIGFIIFILLIRKLRVYLKGKVTCPTTIKHQLECIQDWLYGSFSASLSLRRWQWNDLDTILYPWMERPLFDVLILEDSNLLQKLKFLVSWRNQLFLCSQPTWVYFDTCGIRPPTDRSEVFKKLWKAMKTILSNTNYLLSISKIVFKTGFRYINKFGKFSKLVMQQTSH